MKKYNEHYHLYCDENGSIWNYNGNLLKQRVREGRKVITWWDPIEERYRYAAASHVICDTFYEKPIENAVVIHLDGNLLNDNIENLNWGTRSDSKFLMYEKHRNSYKLKTGSEVFAVESPELYHLCQFAKYFPTLKDAVDAGFNPGRIFSSYKYGCKYKGLYWFIKDSKRFNEKMKK